MCVLSGHLSLSGRANTGDTVKIQLANWVEIKANTIRNMWLNINTVPEKMVNHVHTVLCSSQHVLIYIYYTTLPPHPFLSDKTTHHGLTFDMETSRHLLHSFRFKQYKCVSWWIPVELITIVNDLLHIWWNNISNQEVNRLVQLYPVHLSNKQITFFCVVELYWEEVRYKCINKYIKL